MQQRAATAKKEISALNSKIETTLKQKRNSTLAGAAASEPLSDYRNNVKARRLLRGHFGKITALDWTADGTTIVSAGQDGHLLLWDALSTSKLKDIRLKSAYVMSVAIEASGRYVAAGGLDNACAIYNVGSEGPAQLTTELVSHEGYLADCKFFHSPSKMLTASGDTTSLLWDVEKGKILDTFVEHKKNLTSVELIDQNTFLSASTDTTIKLWDVRTSAKSGSIKTLSGHTGDVNGITTFPGGSTLASCSEDGTVRVWDLRAYAEIASFGELISANDRDPFAEDGDFGFTSLSASKSGRLLFCGYCDGSLVCYDTMSASKDAAYVVDTAHEEYISCVKVSPTGDGVCTGSWDSFLKIFA